MIMGHGPWITSVGKCIPFVTSPLKIHYISSLDVCFYCDWQLNWLSTKSPHVCTVKLMYFWNNNRGWTKEQSVQIVIKQKLFLKVSPIMHLFSKGQEEFGKNHNCILRCQCKMSNLCQCLLHLFCTKQDKVKFLK